MLVSTNWQPSEKLPPYTPLQKAALRMWGLPEQVEWMQKGAMIYEAHDEIRRNGNDDGEENA